MRYRLALDLGTSSLGWAVLRLNEAKQPVAIVRSGVRIFSDGRHAKDGSSLAVQRREARAMRRRRDRLLRRKTRMMQKLIEHGFFPASKTERKALERRYPDPYALRAKGLDEALPPEAFARLLFHLNQRRGFKSNRRTDKADAEGSVLKNAIGSVHRELDERGMRTVGELLYYRLAEQRRSTPGHEKGIRARYRETKIVDSDGKNRINKSYDIYIDRQMVADEFDRIWEVQASFDPDLFNERARQDLRGTLLYQRDLRPVVPGRCVLLPSESRAPFALPICQRFRIYQEVNNLRVQDEFLREVPLTLEQRNMVVEALEKYSKRSFDQLRTLLQLSGNSQFNLEDVKRRELKGNATTAILSGKKYFGKDWHEFSHEMQDEIVEKLCTEESETHLVEWLVERAHIDESRAREVANVTLPDGYGSLSHSALKRLVPVLKASVCSYSDAVREAGLGHHSQFEFSYEADEVEDWVNPDTGEVSVAFKRLPYYAKALRRHVAFGTGEPGDPDEKRYGKIANPTVHIGLNQLRVVVNALMDRYGRPSEVIVELARDLKESKKRRAEIINQQADRQKKNEEIRKKIADARGCREDEIKRWEIEKWILWEELSRNPATRCCPYSGEQIGVEMLLSNEVEIEHILPFSRTLDDSLNNKTVCTVAANRVKGNRTPWEARDDFALRGWDYSGILARARQMPSKSKISRFAEDGYEKWKGEGEGFLARALNDTRYLSRVAKAYMQLVCPGSGVRVIPGRMTAILRRHLGLDELLSDSGVKNRFDHRHHAVDACVIGVTDQGLLQRFANASAQAREEGLRKLVKDFSPPWPTYREHVKRAIDSLWVSHRPDHGYQGAFMQEEAYGFSKDGKVKQKAKGEDSREVKNLIKISDSKQSERHGVNPDGSPRPYKGYIGGSNYCIEIFRNDEEGWGGDVISRFEAYQIIRNAGGEKEGVEKLRNPSRAQNGKPLVMRLMIDDSLRLELSGGLVTMRVVRISQNGQVFMAPLNEANVDARDRDKGDPFKLVSRKPGTLWALKARQVTVSPIGELRDPGFSG